jgi:cytochrome c-type biogenesis protein CcmH
VSRASLGLSRLLVGVLLLLWLLPLTAHADATDDAVRRIASQMMCPVCEGQTVNDSSSGLAKDMRTLIRQKVEAGESDQQVLDDFVASYGDGILTEPPKRGISLGVWFGPLVGLLLGTALLVGVVTAWRRRPTATSEPVTATSLDPAVADELTRFRGEFGA